jgi:hypothetical protein
MRFPLILATLVLVQPTLSAGVLFGGKKPAKPNPADRVPELLGILKTDQDEHKRVSAAEELRQFDPATFPDMVPMLIDVLQNDAKPSVRSEAAETLGRLRPVTKEAGQALEQALAKDGSMRVRMQARYSLLQCHWNGYHSPEKEKPAPPEKAQKPVAATPPSRKSQPISRPAETPPPPLATDSVPPTLPKAPVTAPIVPTVMPKLKPAPAEREGPDLNPPE